MGSVYARNADVILREVAGERLLVPIRSGLADLQAIFTLNSVGTCVWEQLDGTRPLEAVVEKVLERFEVSPGEARVDIALFVEQLLSAGLIEHRS
jgi:hypothetical protein